jgi:hypothetical protein
LLRGDTGKSWVQEQQDGHNKQLDSGTEWATHLIVSLWNYNKNICQTRNEKVHQSPAIRESIEIENNTRTGTNSLHMIKGIFSV